MTTDPNSDNRNKHGKPNRLVHETSPYLQQHAWNPVDWYPWGEEALERARSENRMIFLSIGYSSCHWCHVMERESFEDPRIARLLNKHFVNIKVDREERPDIDAVYMEALQMMTGQGGWPLNVWLTPDQTPIFAGTYFPPEDYHSRPGFPAVINRLVEVYHQNPEKVENQAREMRKALSNDLHDHLSPGDINKEVLDKAFQAYEETYDQEYGGFSGAPKFPMAMGIGFLLRYGHQPGSARAHDMALGTLEQMICGGIYDQVGGGFHRYSTDRKWLVPHFEKMLYDNALLLPVLAEAAQISGRTVFADTVDETVAFLNREMRHPDGAYFSAMDADTDGEEGKFYTFTYNELRELLDDEMFSLVTRHYGIIPEGNWDGVSILHRAVSLEELARTLNSNVSTLNQQLEDAKSQLLDYRSRRTRPGLDDKIITSWNALMLIALCRCTLLLGRDAGDAIRLGGFLEEHAFQDDILYRITDSNGNARQPGFLDDYALLSDGYSRLFEITGDPHWLSLSVHLNRLMMEQFYDDDKAAFRYASHQQNQLIAETRDVFDNAQPGGTTAAIAALYRTGHLAGKPEWNRTAVTAMEPLAEAAASHASAFGYLLQTMHQHVYPGKEIVIVSDPKSQPDPVSQKMIAIWRENFDPNSYLISLTEDQTKTDKLMEKDPLAGTGFDKLYGEKSTLDDKTTAYVCSDFQCRTPVRTPDAFREEIESSE